jgi:hypothetical protein
MQRQFSNRGEALAEVTAARVLARRKQPGKSAGRRVTSNQWFSQRVEEIRRPKTTEPKRNGDVTIVL